MNAARTSTLLLALAIAGCGSDPSTGPGPLIEGTWGGERVGLIVADTTAHVHINCTVGDFRAPIVVGAGGRFTVAGSYLLRAYPVAIGPTLPAELRGELRGRILTLRVVVNDTINGRLETLGPVVVTHDREPEMGPCPICRAPGERMP